jgi:hypothetical protein
MQHPNKQSFAFIDAAVTVITATAHVSIALAPRLHSSTSLQLQNAEL